jgi:Bacterial pre-peptidase C-terminal domain
MINAYRKGWFLKLLFSTILLFSSCQSLPARAETTNKTIYNPVDLPENNEVNDTLTEKDIPTGEGAFARDYLVSLKKGDQVAIDLTSEDFDTIVLLLGEDGTTVAENDDGPDGTTNSLLFVRIIADGKYIIRVRGFGETGGGKFNLKMTPLATIQRK